MILLLLLVGLITYLVFFYSKLRKLPPGPIPFPVIGNFPQLGWLMLRGKGLVDGMREWQNYYGDVYTLWIGPLATVNICEYQLAQEAMVKKGNNFADRPYMYLLWLVREGRGVIGSNGQHWMEQRRFSLHTLRNFGLGRNLMEDRIMLEVDYRCKLLDRDISNAQGAMTLNFAHHLDVTVGNIINRLLFSERFTEENEKKFFDIKIVLDEAMEEGSIFDFYMESWNANHFPFKAKHDKMISDVMMLINFIKKQIEEKKEEIASGKRDLRGEPEDYVDAFLAQMQKEDAEGSFTEDSLVITLVDLWFAGQETTSTTLYWAFSYLTLHPEVIKKVQRELDQVTGRSRALSLADKPITTYLNATITEVLRMSSILVFNLWRTASESTQIGDYMIEKGTAVTAQLSLINSDPDRFVKANEFNPDRFLNNNLDQYSSAFGMGKRACLGESLARAELYLILGNLLLHYDFVADPKNPPSMKAQKEFGNVRRASPFKVTISKRA